ncbi:PKD domain-containing protein [Tenacibaculum amylolyticum]|uniref:PKD domain-containing protein n=1 Tax=Tenacibaculum amylolyticum TaxID=104269 RepID=UPI0038943A98
MKRFFLTTASLAILLFSSCSDSSFETQGVESLNIIGETPSNESITTTPTSPPTSTSTILYDLDFEDDNEGFVGHYSTNTGWHSPNDGVKNITETPYKSDIARGKSEEFHNGSSSLFEGNNTYFLGRAYSGAIPENGGWSDTSGHGSTIALFGSHTTLKFERDYNPNELSIEFDYYGKRRLPIGWSSMLIWLKPKNGGEAIHLSPENNGYQWSKYSTKLSEKIPAGEYDFVVWHAPKGIAIDNIKIYTNEPDSSSKIEVDAGTNSTIVLPTNTFDLNSTITNPDGETISSIKWSKVSGKGVTFSDATNEDTKVSNLQNGEHVFKVTVTNDSGETIEDTVTITVDDSKVLYGFTFEENTNGFSNVNAVVANIDKYCRGQKGDFLPYLGNSYSENNTYFLGINQGDLNAWINPSASEKNIRLTKDYNVNELGIQFSSQTIDPWGDTTKITVTLKSTSGIEIASFSVENSNSWVITNSYINKVIPAGDYILSIKHIGGMNAVDDIYLFMR